MAPRVCTGESAYPDPVTHDPVAHRRRAVRLDVTPRETRRSKVARQRARRRRWVIGVATFLAVVVVGAVAIAVTLVVKGSAVSAQVFKGGGSVFDLVRSGTPLKTDAQGRTNIVIFGTSQDDPGHLKQAGGGGLWLTDSIQILSIDKATKKVAMVAIPRDLWITLPQPCTVGYDAKINAVYECGSGLVGSTTANPATYAAADAKGAQDLMSVLGKVTGIVPQYWVHVDYTVLRQAVNAIGGIDVNIVGDGATGIYDTNLDPKSCRGTDTSCRAVYYPHNGVYHLTGNEALNLSRARGDANPRSYLDFGLNGGDFDRQANQQKVMVAIKDKATSAGVLANPVKIFDLMSALGSNVTTSLTMGEAKTLVELAASMPKGAMRSISLTVRTDPVLITGWADNHTQSIVQPRAGLFDYTELKTYLRDNIAAAATPTPTPSATPSPSG